jgi:integrase
MTTPEALQRFQEFLHLNRLAPLTCESYLGWSERFLRFAREYRPEGQKPSVEDAISAFLSTYQNHSAATVNQALNALAGKSGLYAALGRPVGELPPWVNPTRPFRAPVWTTRAETEAIMAQMDEQWAMVTGFLYGSGLRIGHCMRLRWGEIDFERLTVTVRQDKGDKDRITVLSAKMVQPLIERRERCRQLWQRDRAAGREGVEIPEAFRIKAPSYGKDWPFFWVFPADRESRDPASGIIRRHHVHDRSFAKPLRRAVREAGIAKRLTAHSFRHGFATAYLLAGGNLRELQRLMGHTSMETTEGYLHCLPSDVDRIGSPWDVETRSREIPPSSIIDFRRHAS